MYLGNIFMKSFNEIENENVLAYEYIYEWYISQTVQVSVGENLVESLS